MKKDKSLKQREERWFIRGLYNSFIVVGMLMAFFLCGRHVLTKVSKMDSYLSSKSPYTTLADMVNIHGESGLRLKIPKPVLLQVARDLVPVLASVRNIFEDVYVECKEAVVGEDIERKAKRIQQQQNMQPVVVKPSGASLLYVSSFCKEIFGNLAPLETCRAELKMHCEVDVLAWFDTSPSESAETLEAIQTCLTSKYKQKTDFVTKFNTKIKTQESHARSSAVVPKKGQKLFLFGSMAAVLILVAGGGLKLYQSVMQAIKDKEMEDRMKAIDGRVVMLQPDNLKDEPDMSITSQELMIEKKDEGEEESFGLLTLIMVELRPVVEFYAAMEEVKEASCQADDAATDLGDKDDAEFVVADLIEDISSDLYLWAIIVDQVHLGDEDEGEFESEDPPPMFTLDMSWQENLLENARVGITTIHQCDFDFDIEDDGNGASEDNIVVTGLTVDKDDPLKFVFWKKRLRDVREMLKADALAKLKSKCPTLFAMGWFKENIPKEEAQIEKEDEELKKEAFSKEQELKNDNISEKVRTREKQMSNDVFVNL